MGPFNNYHLDVLVQIYYYVVLEILATYLLIYYIPGTEIMNTFFK